MKNFSSTKLLVATIGLIFGAFITLSMDLPDENEVNGSHYIQPRTGCGGGDNAKTQGRVYLFPGSPSNAGKGYVALTDSEDVSQLKDCNSSSTAASTKDSEGDNEKSTTTTFYFFAQAKEGYKFAGWYKLSGTEYELVSSTALTNTYRSSDALTSAPSINSTVYLDRYAAFAKVVDYSFVQPTGGSYIVENNGIKTTDYSTITVDGVVKLTATASSGYRFGGWYITTDGGATKTYVSFKKTYLPPSQDGDVTFGADFVQIDATPLFWLQGTGNTYTNLNDANTAAVHNGGGTIVLVQDGTLPQGDYEISSGVTLLIPFDSVFTCYKEIPDAMHGHEGRGKTGAGINDYSGDNSYVFRMLTMASGAKLVIKGIVSISAMRWCTIDTGSEGKNLPNISGVFRMHKGYGCITMNEGSTIQVGDGKNAGKLYCWGRIRGEGKITVENGSEVRESWVFTDWRNNDYLAGYAKNTMIFPMNQYYVQDIQVETKFKPGSTEVLRTGIFYTRDYPVQAGDINFIGNKGDDCIFENATEGSSITKRYDIPTDRLIWDLEGGASISTSILKIKGQITLNAPSESEIFPITNNWTINVNSGETTIKSDLALCAGAKINIAEDASVRLLSGASMYVYDADDWVWAGSQKYGKGFASGRRIIPLYLPSCEVKANTYKDAQGNPRYIKSTQYSGKSKFDAIRLEADLTDAEILVNGTLIVEGGVNNIYIGRSGGGAYDPKFNAVTPNDISGIYTTNGVKVGTKTLSSGGDNVGAKIYSTQSGRIMLEQGAGVQTETFQLDSGTNYYDKATINIVPAKLYNGDGAATMYTSTATPIGGLNYPRKYTYSTEEKIWKMEYIKKEVDPETEEEKTEVSGLHKEVVVTGDAEGESATATVTAEVVTEKVTVENGGILDVQAQINTTDFIICAEEMYVDDGENDEGGKSGEVLITDASKINNDANIYFDLKLNAADPAKIADQWHAFCVPFPVDLNAGVTCYQGETPIANSKNEVDYAIMQYQGDVRAQGKYGWIKVYKTGAKELTPGVFYLLTVNEGTTSVRFTKKAGSSLIANPEVTVNPYTISGEGDETKDKGWNGVGNPNLFKGNLSTGITNAYILDPISYGYICYDSEDFAKIKIAVGTPYFVQNKTDNEQQTAKFIDANNDPVSVPSRLLAKQTEAKSIASQKVYLRRNNTTFRDKLYVSASEDATGDLSDEGNYFKLQRTSTPKVPQIYAISNDTKLAGMRAVLSYDDAEIPLGLYAPQADTYTIFTNPSDDVTIYLAKDGEIIANLTEGDYKLSLAKGTTNEYSLRLVRKITDIGTSTKEVSTDAAKAEKIILNGNLYILRDGKMYNAQGTRF